MYSGAYVNALDIAPRYASILRGFATAVSYLALKISNQWDGKAILLPFWIRIARIIVYLFFASGERQPWAEPIEGEEDPSLPIAETREEANIGTETQVNEGSAKKSTIVNLI